MVAALPEAEKNKLLHLEKDNSHHFSNLYKVWKSFLHRHFDYNPDDYVTQLMKAKNPGTLSIVKEIIHEDKIPLTL